MSKTIKQSITEIKQQIEDENNVYWYLINLPDVQLVAEGDKKTSKKMLEKRIAKHSKKFIGSRLWKITIDIFDEKKDKMSGDIRIMLENYTVSKDLNIEKKAEVDRTGPIWFTKTWLEFSTWKKFSYISKIIKNVLTKKVTLKMVGPNFFHKKFL